MKIGIYYSSSTGNTTEVADAIQEKLGDAADAAVAIEDVADPATVASHELLIVGTPTWNTDSDDERSGTAWDEWLYDDLPKLDLKGKSVAVFGLGDASGYAAYFCDAIEEVHDCFEKQGAKMIGYTAKDDYEFEESKSVRGEQFIGLPMDVVNGPYDIEERVGKWVDGVLKEAGM